MNLSQCLAMNLIGDELKQVYKNSSSTAVDNSDDSFLQNIEEGKFELIIEIKTGNAVELYGFWKQIGNEIPYYFNTCYDDWLKSMFSDTNSEGEILFKELFTYAYYEKSELSAFI